MKNMLFPVISKRYKPILWNESQHSRGTNKHIRMNSKFSKRRCVFLAGTHKDSVGSNLKTWARD